MHPAVRQAVSHELTRALRGMESRRGVVIGAELESFMSGIVSESLDVRQSEWKKNGLDPNDADNSSKIASKVADVVRLLIGESETYAFSEGKKRILLISFLQLAHKNWCGIFPFCR
jgi:hypothetical protein